MDRTEASDAFDAGSIPVGCIYYLKRKGIMDKKNLKDHISFKEVLHNISSSVKDNLLYFKEWISDYGKIFLPLSLLILVSVTVIVSLNAREKVEQAAKEALEVLEETKAEVQEVKETGFEEDAYPGINSLMQVYYEALEMADIDMLNDIQSAVSGTESIRLQKMSEYIDRYENIHVYTKPGPYADTYIAYVTTDVYLKGRTELIPGLQAFYICMDENGNYYINNSELSEEEALYIKNVTMQSDVLDLKNSVNVSYSNIMEENLALSEYWADTSVEIDLAVGEQLASEAKLLAQLDESENKEAEEETPAEEEAEPVIRKVRTTDRVNIRKSASSAADKIGAAQAGDTFILLETMPNGWTKVSYEGAEAYISTQYLEELEDISNIESSGTITVNTGSLNVRSEPDASSGKLGVLVEGQVVDLIERADGWCKIKFNGQIGYVKEEYVK